MELKKPEIEYNPNAIWEQVLYFLNKKDKALEKKKEEFFNKIIPALELALLSEQYLEELEVPMKKNESNLNYDIIKLIKVDVLSGVETVYDKSGNVVLDDEGNVKTEPKYLKEVSWFINNEEVSDDYIKEYFDIDRIIIFENNLLNLFESLHFDRNKLLRNITYSQDYLKQELNPKNLNIKK